MIDTIKKFFGKDSCDCRREGCAVCKQSGLVSASIELAGCERVEEVTCPHCVGSKKCPNYKPKK